MSNDDETTTPLCRCGQAAEYTSPGPMCAYHWAIWYVAKSPRGMTPEERDHAVAATLALFIGEVRNEVADDALANATKSYAATIGKLAGTMQTLFAAWLDEIAVSEAGSCSGSTAHDLAFSVRDGDFEAWLNGKVPAELVGVLRAGGAGRETGGDPPSGSGG